MTRASAVGKPSAQTRPTSSGEQPVKKSQAARVRRTTRARRTPLGEEDVAAVDADAERRARGEAAGERAVGQQPVSLHDVGSPQPKRAPHRAPGAGGVERRREQRGAAHALVGGEAAAVAEQLERHRRVAEGLDLDAAVVAPAAGCRAACGASTRTRSPPRTSASASSRMNGPAVSSGVRG